MKFSDYAKVLRTNIGGDKTTADFTYELFFHITAPNEEMEEKLNVGTDTYKKYFSGARSVKKLAQMILPYLDKERFAEYLMEKCSLEVSANIIADFAEQNFLTCQSDFVDNVTELFCDILRSSAGSKKAGAKTPNGAAEDENVREYLLHLREKFYSTKTLLYTVAPKPVNDFYVPNDL